MLKGAATSTNGIHPTQMYKYYSIHSFIRSGTIVNGWRGFPRFRMRQTEARRPSSPIQYLCIIHIIQVVPTPTPTTTRTKQSFIHSKRNWTAQSSCRLWTGSRRGVAALKRRATLVGGAPLQSYHMHLLQYIINQYINYANIK